MARWRGLGWCCGIVAAHAVLSSGEASAQEPTRSAQPAQQRTHTVRPGDTLWDIARTYLGDPFLWPEIYRVNTNVIEDPHWIFPNEVLVIPGAGPVAAAATPGEPVVLGTQRETGTVFGQRAVAQQDVTLRQGVMGRMERPEVRWGEYVRAPFADRRGGPQDAGALLRLASIPGTDIGAVRDRLMIGDLVYVRLPGNTLPLAGDRFVTYALGPELENGGQLVMPTGVVQVERPSAGEATIVRVVQQFDDQRLGQGFIAIDSLSIPPSARPALVEQGPPARVVWIEGDPVLASIQKYVLLSATDRESVRPGDQFTLVRARRQVEDGTVYPEREIAVAQVMKVTPFGTTALVIHQTEPAIREGITARLTAKMP